MPDLSATRINAITFGVVTGLAGIEHGLFEALQGSVVPDGLVIEAIGPEHRFWDLGTETALTIVPNFLLTGVLAMSLGLGMLIWSIAFVQTRYGAHVLALLSAMLFLFGGGIAPLGSGIVAVIAAARIDKPMIWWRVHIPGGVRVFLAGSWKGALLVVVVTYLFCLLGAISGWPLLLFFDAMTVNKLLLVIGLAVLAVMFYLIPAGFAFDMRNRV
jgi:hypothetical protein